VNNLKPSYCYATKDNPVLVSPEIEIFTLENENVDLSYLIMQLKSDFVLKQVEIYSQGLITQRLNLQNILKLKIIVPDMDLQNSLIRQKALVEGAKIQSDKDKIETLQLQSTIDTLLKERINDFQWNLHDIRNGELLNLVGKVGVLDFFSDDNADSFDQVIDQEKNMTTHSVIKEISTSVKNLATFLSELYDPSDNIYKKEDIDILNFIEDFCDKQSKSTSDLFEIDYSCIEKVKNDFEIFELIISANKKDLERVVTNIFQNAVKHGGFENSNQINKIKIDFNINANKQIVKIAILNNGRASEISSLNYFADGGKAGPTSNTGKGGHIIKILTERNNGKVFQNNYSLKEAGGFTFEVSIQFNYK
jgi:type I restriction enzyme M protein